MKPKITFPKDGTRISNPNVLFVWHPEPSHGSPLHPSIEKLCRYALYNLVVISEKNKGYWNKLEESIIKYNETHDFKLQKGHTYQIITQFTDQIVKFPDKTTEFDIPKDKFPKYINKVKSRNIIQSKEQNDSVVFMIKECSQILETNLQYFSKKSKGETLKPILPLVLMMLNRYEKCKNEPNINKLSDLERSIYESFTNYFDNYSGKFGITEDEIIEKLKQVTRDLFSGKNKKLLDLNSKLYKPEFLKLPIEEDIQKIVKNHVIENAIKEVFKDNALISKELEKINKPTFYMAIALRIDLINNTRQITRELGRYPVGPYLKPISKVMMEESVPVISKIPIYFNRILKIPIKGEAVTNGTLKEDLKYKLIFSTLKSKRKISFPMRLIHQGDKYYLISDNVFKISSCGKYRITLFEITSTGIGKQINSGQAIMYGSEPLIYDISPVTLNVDTNDWDKSRKIGFSSKNVGAIKGLKCEFPGNRREEIDIKIITEKDDFDSVKFTSEEFKFSELPADTNFNKYKLNDFNIYIINDESAYDLTFRYHSTEKTWEESLLIDGLISNESDKQIVIREKKERIGDYREILSYIPVDVKCYKYSLLLDRILCIDESSPEWWFSDTIFLTSYINTNLFIQYPLTTGKYGGFDDNEERKDIDEKDKWQYLAFNDPQETDNKDKKEDFREIEGSLVISIACFEYDNLDALQKYLKALTSLFLEALVFVANYFTYGIGGTYLEFIIDRTGLEDFIHEQIGLAAAGWEVELLGIGNQSFIPKDIEFTKLNNSEEVAKNLPVVKIGPGKAEYDIGLKLLRKKQK